MNRLLVTELNTVQEILKMSSCSVLFSHYGQVLLTSIKAFCLCNKSKDKCFPRENKEIKLMGKTNKTQPPPPHMIPLWYGWLTQQKLTTAALSVVTCPGLFGARALRSQRHHPLPSQYTLGTLDIQVCSSEMKINLLQMNSPNSFILFCLFSLVMRLSVFRGFHRWWKLCLTLILLPLLPSPTASVAEGLRIDLETWFSIPVATLQVTITALRG